MISLNSFKFHPIVEGWEEAEKKIFFLSCYMPLLFLLLLSSIAANICQVKHNLGSRKKNYGKKFFFSSSKFSKNKQEAGRKKFELHTQKKRCIQSEKKTALRKFFF